MSERGIASVDSKDRNLCHSMRIPTRVFAGDDLGQSQFDVVIATVVPSHADRRSRYKVHHVTDNFYLSRAKSKS